MSTIYNRIAGNSLDRIAALSDGVFAIAMTLLVLDLHVPEIEPIHTEGDLWNAIIKLSPRLLTYFMSFLTLGIFWVGQQTQFNNFARTNRDLSWIHLGFLLVVTLMPFSTSFLADFIGFRLAMALYWLNIFLLGLLLFISWWYAGRAGLLKPEVDDELKKAARRRIVIAQALYAVGALLCLINTYLSIVVIIVIQLNYAIAPRIRGLYKL